MRLVISLIIVSLSLAACSNLSKSASTLRHNYLAITSPGISMDETIPLIKKKIKPEGSLLIREGIPCLDKEEIQHQKGAHSIRVNLGWYYWGTVNTPVYGEWCFNDNKKLIDIIIYKAIDDRTNGY
ncbi:MAG: hypothetical protein OEY06_02890 [Gammaproteobacteria bacterium]|nr:hypothetical protein [Gammaproteobacteria bacterium]